MRGASSRSRAHRRLAWLSPLLVVALVALALAIRALGFETVLFDANVVFPAADPQYHVRRAFYTFVNFPAILLFDPYINYPGGAPVAWPPLYDFVTGGVARLLADGRYGFELVMAWSGPVIGALGVIPVYLIGRRMDSRTLGLLSAGVFALLREGASYSRIGYADHHAAVGTLGAWLLYACLRALTSSYEARDRVGVVVLLVLTRLGLLLTWHGSLLYLVPFEGAMLVGAVAAGRRRLPLLQGASAAIALLCLVPIVAALPPPLGGSCSAIALSWLHVLALGGVVLLCSGLFALARISPRSSAPVRLGIVAGLAVFYLAALLLFGPVREGLTPAFRFLTMTDAAGQYTLEQMPLYLFFGRSAGPSAVYSWGLFAYLIPVLPLGVLLLTGARAGDARRSGLLLVAGWGIFFGTLAVLQLRYANDFCPAASLLIGSGLLGIGRRVATRWKTPGHRPAIAVVVALLLFVLLYQVPLTEVYLPLARGSWAALRGQPNPLARRSVFATLTFFARDVRRLTPETSGYLEPGRPEYGIIAQPNLGHALHNVARRATATDPFWSYIGEENWQRTMAFLRSPDEQTALGIAQLLDARYVVTTDTDVGRGVMGQLHQHDGRASYGRRPLAHFRLLTEAPVQGQSLGGLSRSSESDSVPYKLFEIVPGARLEVQASPGQPVLASLDLLTKQGRAFTYSARAATDDEGRATLVVPYSTSWGEAAPPAGTARPGALPVGPWEVRVAERSTRVHVPESAVLNGDSIPVRIE